jgi:hypothetical protein
MVKKKEQLGGLNHLKTDLALATVAATPSAFALIGGLLRGAPGAALGGALGEGVKDFVKGDILDKKITPQQYAKDTSIEATKQFLFEKGGDKLGEVFFKQLAKLPHAVN